MDVWLELMRAVGVIGRRCVQCYSLRGLWAGGEGVAKQVSEKVPLVEASVGLKLLRGRRRHT